MLRFLLASLCLAAPLFAANTKPNVLLILVDDLKPTLGCYGDTTAKTPSIDALAKSGLRFDLAYCNQAVCGPSRFNLMLGSFSTSTGLYHLHQSLRDVIPDAVTMPQYFRRAGYRAESLGKTFHVGHGAHGDPQSWSVSPYRDKLVEYLLPESNEGKLSREEAFFTNASVGPINALPRGAAWESPDVPDDAYADGRVAAEAIKCLEAAKDRDEPFFLAVGFVRPHLPFCAPKKYWDLYDPDKLPMPEYEKDPVDAPKVALKRGGEITNYKPVPEHKPIRGKLRRELIHGYYASASYSDAQVGKVLAALDRLGLDDNTIVLLWGDHGWHLGDHSYWTKHTNFEQANRIPLIIRAPGVTQAGSSTRQLAQTVDVYPTLAELAGLPRPGGPQPIDGLSLVPVLKNPSVRIRDHIYHAYPHAKLGRAIRTERYRMVEWKRPGAPAETAEIELYDYRLDPLEKRNVAGSQPRVVEKLRAILANYPEAK